MNGCEDQAERREQRRADEKVADSYQKIYIVHADSTAPSHNHYQLQGCSISLHHITIFRIFVLPWGKLQNSYLFDHYRLMSDPLSIAASVAGFITLEKSSQSRAMNTSNAFESQNRGRRVDQ
jgi:hypothetical protein